ncbi:antifreeze protein [Mycena olivaceomarginata]|nr:antifreeze protein [Mycena olivaceomarginata]
MFSTQFTVYFLTVLGSVVALGPAAVNLRSAANYAILAKSGPGLSALAQLRPPVLTGFSLTVDSTGQFSTSAQVTGKLFAASYFAPTPSTLTVAIGDMGTAFTDAAGRSFSLTDHAGAIGGRILTPGLYNWNSAVNIGSDVSGGLSIAAGARVTLAGGARTSNIVWCCRRRAPRGCCSGKSSITLLTGATANSRLLSQTGRRAPKGMCKHALLFWAFC